MRMAGPVGPALGPEAAQEATAASIPSTQAASTATLPASKVLQQQEVAFPMSPAVEAFIPTETALKGAGGASNVAPQPTQPPEPYDVATA